MPVGSSFCASSLQPTPSSQPQIPATPFLPTYAGHSPVSSLLPTLTRIGGIPPPPSADTVRYKTVRRSPLTPMHPETYHLYCRKYPGGGGCNHRAMSFIRNVGAPTFSSLRYNPVLASPRFSDPRAFVYSTCGHSHAAAAEPFSDYTCYWLPTKPAGKMPYFSRRKSLSARQFLASTSSKLWRKSAKPNKLLSRDEVLHAQGQAVPRPPSLVGSPAARFLV